MPVLSFFCPRTEVARFPNKKQQQGKKGGKQGKQSKARRRRGPTSADPASSPEMEQTLRLTNTLADGPWARYVSVRMHVIHFSLLRALRFLSCGDSARVLCCARGPPPWSLGGPSELARPAPDMPLGRMYANRPLPLVYQTVWRPVGAATAANERDIKTSTSITEKTLIRCS